MHSLFHHFRHHHHHGFHAFDMEGGEHGCHAGRHGPFDEPRGGADFSGWGGLRGGGRHGGGRMFGHGDLKLLLLALIEQQPRHGYELIRMIEEMFHGQYTPSPGAIYPTLSMLEDMGYAQVESEAGNRKLYAITAEGRAFLHENRAAVDAATARTEHSAKLAAKMAAPMRVRKAMHALKHALLMRTSWDKAEAERVAAVLERAASEIATGRPQD
ncbi:PadR family transcriptional regulator [Rhodanobacter sp. C06]|uniref:PadR family transcriptional regulator n=1 Tax=Rhodanobacter sp. C06 TaxID=1945854 RepID=UPI0009867268|nr:PadR family transcriptional regulator [Rhodanobacter sp. C06]OOG41749.1 PadR family transcriptional regulator [Rhodanobacter sp. C06]